MYRKQHKKDIAAEAVKKKRRATKKPYSRSIVGATLEVIQKKRAEKPEVRDAAREAALREIKERIKKTKDEKKAKKAELMAKTQKTQTKGAGPKGIRYVLKDAKWMADYHHSFVVSSPPVLQRADDQARKDVKGLGAMNNSGYPSIHGNGLSGSILLRANDLYAL
ncbi:hypothetical protein OIU84_004098 [Salix udensis]|uniref:Uncharacterized protein n=1 Tax=Salix udensis TaxID=889485 RepID=A0AAD6P3T6_9ROSI|nr:hypothetical protein OIU84_004098 [Salix udensis]